MGPQMKRLLPRTLLPLIALAACWWYARSPQAAPSPPGEAPVPAPVSQQPAIPVHAANARIHPAATSSAPSAPAALLRDSIGTLRSSPGLTAQVDVRIVMLGQDFSGQGTFTQQGEGYPRTRWDIKFPTLDPPLNTVQIFDGRFHYRVQSRGDQRELVFLDQYHVPGIDDPGYSGLAGPAAWFGVGGLPTMLEHLARTFDLEVADAPGQAPAGGGSIAWTTLEGTWHPAVLQRLLRGQVAEADLSPAIRWDRLPRQIPRAVRIALGTDSYLARFPYRITFSFATGRDGQPSFSGDRIEWQLHHVTLQESVDPSAFVIDSRDVVPADRTADYLARLKMFLQQPPQ